MARALVYTEHEVNIMDLQAAARWKPHAMLKRTVQLVLITTPSTGLPVAAGRMEALS